jgi:hypothetical protein
MTTDDLNQIEEIISNISQMLLSDRSISEYKTLGENLKRAVRKGVYKEFISKEEPIQLNNLIEIIEKYVKPNPLIRASVIIQLLLSIMIKGVK